MPFYSQDHLVSFCRIIVPRRCTQSYNATTKFLPFNFSTNRNMYCATIKIAVIGWNNFSRSEFRFTIVRREDLLKENRWSRLKFVFAKNKNWPCEMIHGVVNKLRWKVFVFFWQPTPLKVRKSQNDIFKPTFLIKNERKNST